MKRHFGIMLVLATVSALSFADRAVERRFSCSTVNPIYSALDTKLNVRTTYDDGDITSASIFTFKFRTACEQVSARLTNSCGHRHECGVTFCEPQNAIYPALDATLYQVRHEGRALQVVTVDTFRLMSDCQAAQ